MDAGCEHTMLAASALGKFVAFAVWDRWTTRWRSAWRDVALALRCSRFVEGVGAGSGTVALRAASVVVLPRSRPRELGISARPTVAMIIAIGIASCACASVQR
jgi:hypothetical protein